MKPLNEKYHNRGLLAVGFVIGFCGSALGIGGGVIAVPVLSLLFGFDFKRAVSTSLATIIPAVTVGSISYFIWDIKTGQSNIILSIAAITAIGTVIGSFLGVKIAHITHDRLLKIIFAAMLIITSLKLLNILKIPTSMVETSPWPYLILLGVFAGFASGMLGIGGGVIIVPALTLFFVDSIHQAIPTSLVVIIPTTIAGTMFHNKMRAMNFQPLRFLIPTAAIGAIGGVFLKNSLPEDTLRGIFGIFIIICSIKMLLSHSNK